MYKLMDAVPELSESVRQVELWDGAHGASLVFSRRNGVHSCANLSFVFSRPTIHASCVAYHCFSRNHRDQQIHTHQRTHTLYQYVFLQNATPPVVSGKKTRKPASSTEVALRGSTWHPRQKRQVMPRVQETSVWHDATCTGDLLMAFRHAHRVQRAQYHQGRACQLRGSDPEIIINTISS
jgi:hypothetical protein